MPLEFLPSLIDVSLLFLSWEEQFVQSVSGLRGPIITAITVIRFHSLRPILYLCLLILHTSKVTIDTELSFTSNYVSSFSHPSATMHISSSSSSSSSGPLLICAAVLSSWLLPAATAQSTTPGLVVGVSTGIDNSTGARPSRININDLYAEAGPHWYVM